MDKWIRAESLGKCQCKQGQVPTACHLQVALSYWDAAEDVYLGAWGGWRSKSGDGTEE